MRRSVTPCPPSASGSPPATSTLYLLQGDDEVEKSALAHEFEELVEEGLRGFNVDRIYAGDIRTGDDWPTRWRRS